MDTTTVTPELLEKAPWVAIGLVAMWLFKSGYLDKFWVWRKEDRKETREEAKEGPLMVLEEVKQQLAEAKSRSAADKLEHTRQMSEMKTEHSKQMLEVLTELREIRKQHGDCEKNHAALLAEVQFLRNEVDELRGKKE